MEAVQLVAGQEMAPPPLREEVHPVLETDPIDERGAAHVHGPDREEGECRTCDAKPRDESARNHERVGRDHGNDVLERST